MTEKGFYHPYRGYWQTIGAVTEAIVSGYPEGTIEVPLRPGENFELSGGVWLPTPHQTNLQPAQLRSLSAEEFIIGLLYLNVMPSQIDAAIASLTEPDRSLAAWRWQRAQSFARNDWLIEELAAALQISDAALDEAWLHVIAVSGQ